MRLLKYTQQDVINEADMLLSGCSLAQISSALKIPVSTVSWHLIYALVTFDYHRWVEVRKRLNKYAKSELRAYTEYLFVKSVESGTTVPISQRR